MINTKEEWRDISGYEGIYQVSNLGRVKSLVNGGQSRLNGKERILKPGENKYGYLSVNLCKYGNRKMFKIHRLVAQAFLSNSENFPEVNHKDENPKNNHSSNLEWCDRKYNCNYGTRNERMRKTKSKKVICIETNFTYESVNEASRQTGFDKGNISKCCLGKSKTTGGYHWKYIE